MFVPLLLVPGVASGNEIAHQLHVLQTLMLNVLEEPMNRPIESGDVEAQEKIRELRRIAFDNDGSDSITPLKDVATRKQIIPRDFRKLGFKNDATPLNDFGTVFWEKNERLHQLSNFYNIFVLQLRFHQVHWLLMLCSILPATTQKNIPGLCSKIRDEETNTIVHSPERSLNSQSYCAKFSRYQLIVKHFESL